MKKQKNIQKKMQESGYLATIRQASLYSFFVFMLCIIFFVIGNAVNPSSDRKVGVRHDGVVVLPEMSIAVEIAKTPKELEKGLSGRISMEDKEGMFFVFNSMGKYSFWMKDMNFPLDIIWISDEGRVMYIAENVTTKEYKSHIYTNEALAKYVLEIKAGSAKKYGVYLGTSITLPSL